MLGQISQAETQNTDIVKREEEEEEDSPCGLQSMMQFIHVFPLLGNIIEEDLHYCVLCKNRRRCHAEQLGVIYWAPGVGLTITATSQDSSKHDMQIVARFNSFLDFAAKECFSVKPHELRVTWCRLSVFYLPREDFLNALVSFLCSYGP